jgi:hypothetical protein
VSEAAGEGSAVAEETDRLLSSVEVVAGVLAREDQTGGRLVREGGRRISGRAQSAASWTTDAD